MDFQGEGFLSERAIAAGFFALRILFEELEVGHVVEDLEFLLVIAGAKKILAQACPATKHLPELGHRENLFIENKVYDFRHIDASIKHID